MTLNRITDLNNNYNEYMNQDRNLLVDIEYQNKVEEKYYNKYGWTISDLIYDDR